jgi:hypothetical protein
MTKHIVVAMGLMVLAAPALGQGTASYDPIISVADFTPVIRNKYYTLKPGMNAGYEQVMPKGIRHLESGVAGDTRVVMGITTLVVRQREWLNGRLLEDTKGWVAQDRTGNVWFFGESVKSYKNGRLVSTDGSWEAGVDGAKPGILMLHDPKPGATYRREYLPGKAEDMGTVVAVGISVRIPQGPLFQNCVHLREWSPLEKGDIENKYYCAGIAGMVLTEEPAIRFKLVSFKKGAQEEPRWRSALTR